MFGSKPSSTSFTFGSPATSTNTNTTPSKPLFGSTTQQQTTTNLFGNTNTPAATGSMFGTTAATTGATPTTGSLFGNASTTNTGGGLFGNKQATTSSGGLFGSTTSSGGLFGSKPNTGFGASNSTGGLFGSKPGGGNLFGSTTASTHHPQTRQRETLDTIILNADALVRSLTCPELYGDDRDQIIAKLNQVAAALGVGNGFYKDGQSIIYSAEGPFHRLKAVGYNMISEYTETDGVVSLHVKAPISELSTSAQKQAVIDKIYAIIGSNPQYPVKIKGIKELPDNQTEINIYVVNKSSGTPAPCSALASLLSEQAKKIQLEQQLKVDKIIARFAMDKYQKERFIKDPPAGFDDVLWQQACRENPDPDHLLPFPIRGFEQLLSRQKTQNTEVMISNKVIDNLVFRLRTLETQGEFATVKINQQKVLQKQLSHRLLRILSYQLIQQRFGHPIDSTEENVKGALEVLSAKLNGPFQIRERLSELTEALQDNNSELQNKLEFNNINLAESDIQQLQKYLSRCQDGLESLSNIVRENMIELQRIGVAID